MNIMIKSLQLLGAVSPHQIIYQETLAKHNSHSSRISKAVKCMCRLVSILGDIIRCTCILLFPQCILFFSYSAMQRDVLPWRHSFDWQAWRDGTRHWLSLLARPFDAAATGGGHQWPHLNGVLGHDPYHSTEVEGNQHSVLHIDRSIRFGWVANRQIITSNYDRYCYVHLADVYYYVLRKRRRYVHVYVSP